MTGSGRALVAVLAAGCRLGFDPAVGGDGGGGATDGAPDDGAPGDGAPGDGTLVTTPIARWGFDEGSGQLAGNSGSGGAGGVLGTTMSAEARDPQWVTLPARVCTGAALTFDGGDDIVTIPGPSAANLSRFSVAFSLHATGSGGGTLPRVLSKEDGGQADLIIHVRSDDNAIAINMFNAGNTLFATFARGVVLNERANWVVRYDDAGDRRVHVFKNGVETTYLRQDALTGTMRMTTQPWMIGNQGTGVRGLAGTLDEIRVYDVALSGGEIAALSALCPP